MRYLNVNKFIFKQIYFFFKKIFHFNSNMQKDEAKNKNDKKTKKENSSSDNEEEEVKIEKPSYTYWKRDSDKAADHAGFQPQIAKNPVQEQAQNNKIGSVWNKAGTWEEKRMNKNQIEDFFNEHVKNTPYIYKDAFKMQSFSSYSGDVK